MKQLTLNPVRHVAGEVRLPGSKSLSNRILLLSALARGSTDISNLLYSDDVERMLAALSTLGVSLTPDSAGLSCRVTGSGGALPSHASCLLELGNAGTAIRPLCAALCLSPGNYVLTGDPAMKKRPIAHLVEALISVGAGIDYLEESGYPPVRIAGGGLRGGTIRIPGHISSQYLTALLMALPLAPGDSRIEVIGDQVSKPYLDITLDVMARFGVEATHHQYQEFLIPGRQSYQSPGRIMVEGDASSASYFLAAAAIRGGTVRVHGVGRRSVQGDVAFADVLERMGAVIRRGDDWIEASRGDLNGVDMDLNHIPDAAMTIATTALFARGATRIRNIYNWRVKETNRLEAMATELRKVGAEVETGDDYIVIDPPPTLQSAEIDTYDDHRIAMCFSLAALGEVPITIRDPDCTSKTFPTYFEEFNAICQ